MSLTRVNTISTHVIREELIRVNMNQHESDKSQQESTRVNISQVDHEIIIVYGSLVEKVW